MGFSISHPKALQCLVIVPLGEKCSFTREIRCLVVSPTYLDLHPGHSIWYMILLLYILLTDGFILGRAFLAFTIVYMCSIGAPIFSNLDKDLVDSFTRYFIKKSLTKFFFRREQACSTSAENKQVFQQRGHASSCR